MTFLKYVLPVIGLAANAALAAQVEFVGEYSLDIDRDEGEVTVEIEELRNASRTETTGPLFLSLRYTLCDSSASRGGPAFQPEEDPEEDPQEEQDEEQDEEQEEDERPGFYSLDRVVPGGDSRLAPQGSWVDIRFTTKYSPPPSGTYRRHLVVYEVDYSESEAGVLRQAGSATFPYRQIQQGPDDLDSCFSARPIDANGSQRAYLSIGDRGDFYRLQSHSKGTLQAEYDGNAAAHGELLDARGLLLTSVNVGAEAGNFLIERHIDDRVYYIRVAKPWGENGYYNLRTRVVQGTGGDATDRDDDIVQLASPLPLGMDVGDAIDVPGDVDWWYIETQSPGRLVIETTGGADTQGSLLSRFVEELAHNDDGGEGRNFRIDDPAPFEAGTYYIRVMGNRVGNTGPYTLRAVHIPEDESGRPDLVVDFPGTDTVQLKPDEPFIFVIRLRNRGNGPFDRSALRLYRSANRVISTADARLDTTEVSGLDALMSSEHFMRFPGLARTGTHFVGACVRVVEEETDFGNNCSSAVPVVVSEPAAGDATEPAARRYSLPLILSASGSRRQGFVRIVNRSDAPGQVSMLAVDDAGMSYGPIELELSAQETVHFGSSDLESGNPEKGIMAGTGTGQGDWRLELTTKLDLAPLAYVRTSDGFLTGMVETASTLDDGRYYIPFFNPASNRGQVSSLRLVNPGTEDADIGVTGIDDRGQPPPEGEVWLNLPAGQARVITARELESGGDGLQGRFGDGSGKWRLFLSSTAPIETMNLLDSPGGKLSNLSSPGRRESLPLVLPASEIGRESFIRIINRSESEGTVRILGLDDTGRATAAVTLTLGASAAAQLTSEDLEAGNEPKGLGTGIGQGEGFWRLGLQSDLDVEVLAYARTADGFVTGMHDLAVDVNGIVDVPFFNPAGNVDPASRLRLANSGVRDATVAIAGWDDIGRGPPYGTVRLTVPAGESRTFTAQQLETGASGLRGRFGDGAGRWRLSIASEQPLGVMSLLESPAGALTNLSGAGGMASEPVSGE